MITVRFGKLTSIYYLNSKVKQKAVKGCKLLANFTYFIHHAGITVWGEQTACISNPIVVIEIMSCEHSHFNVLNKQCE
jgi:hypothetical protein